MWMPLRRVADVVRAGGVVAYPTEGVFGLGCDPLDVDAVVRLLTIKQRDPEAGLILLAADVESLRPWIDVTDEQVATMQSHWPGPTTFLVPPSPKVPGWIRGRHDTVAVRVSGHPLARELSHLCGFPIVSTSANVSGRPAAENGFQLHRQLGEQLDAVLEGECQQPGRPSRIIDLQSGAVLRGATGTGSSS
jgi:L-threonylcarbamoyladenylate synthase